MVLRKHNGFSLIELMIAMAISTVVGLLIYQVHSRQQKSHVAQQLSVEMQQNLRAAMSFMRREIRMAGYNPAEIASPPPWRIQTAAANTFGFSLDLTLPLGNGTTTDQNERLTYGFTSGDADGNGVADSGALSLMRQDAGGTPSESEIAYDIQAIAFAYAYDSDDSDDLLDTFPPPPANGNIIWAFDADGDGDLDTALDSNNDGNIDTDDIAGGSPLTGPPFFLPSDIDIDRIRAVRTWVLARTRFPIRGFSDNETYVVGVQRVTPGDNYQHSLVVDTVICRNMFLEP